MLFCSAVNQKTASEFTYSVQPDFRVLLLRWLERFFSRKL